MGMYFGNCLFWDYGNIFLQQWPTHFPMSYLVMMYVGISLSRNKLNFTTSPFPKKAAWRVMVFFFFLLWKLSQPTNYSLLIKSLLWVEHLRAKKTMRLEHHSMCQCLLLFYPYLNLCGLLWFSIGVKHPVLLCSYQIRKSKKEVFRWPGESVMRSQICEPLFCTHLLLLVLSHCKLFHLPHQGLVRITAAITMKDLDISGRK